MLDLVEVKAVSELSARDIAGESPDMKGTDDVLAFLQKIYGHAIDEDEKVTVIYFSEITD